MPKDLPGFYYDAEKNRYFPIKNPIPGSSSHKLLVTKPSVKTIQRCSQSGVRSSKLLQARELCGNFISTNKKKCNFEEEFLKTQASHPTVWRYPETGKMGDSALERVYINVQMPEGDTKVEVLLTGGKNGNLSISEVVNLQPHLAGIQSIPARVWPTIKDCQTRRSISPGNIVEQIRTSELMPSTISSIKRIGTSSPFAVESGDSIHHALLCALGSEKCGGSLYVLNLMESSSFYHPSPFHLSQRKKKVASLECTIWTADCGTFQNRAAIGTNLGAALVDLESGTKSWVLCSQSDVLALQFAHSGNAILCGLRNGAIVTADTREKQVGSSSSTLSRRTTLVRHKISYSHTMTNKVGSSSKPWFKVSGNFVPADTVTLPSSISCLVALQFDDRYFFASSMDGSVKLYDLRLIQRGAVQSYEGHVNSHTRIQLGVDPCERFVMSGGEDSYLRLWSIKSGELLFQEKFSDSILSTVCWRGGRSNPSIGHGRENEAQGIDECLDVKGYGTGAWLGSAEGLFYVQCL